MPFPLAPSQNQIHRMGDHYHLFSNNVWTRLKDPVRASAVDGVLDLSLGNHQKLEIAAGEVTLSVAQATSGTPVSQFTLEIVAASPSTIHWPTDCYHNENAVRPIEAGVYLFSFTSGDAGATWAITLIHRH